VRRSPRAFRHTSLAAGVTQRYTELRIDDRDALLSFVGSL
jgi:hypothetical protein